MGRHIYCGDDWVHKYTFARQPSEMARIHEELGLGYYDLLGSGQDMLELSREDAYQLRQELQKRGYNALKGEHDSLLAAHPEGANLDVSGQLQSIIIGSPYDKAETAFVLARDWDYLVMLDRIASYIEAHPDTQEPFVFEGEF